MPSQLRLPIVLLLLPLASMAQDLDTVLERNAAAHGGTENWARIENVRIQLTIAEPGFELSGTYVATRKGSMRIDVEADGERVFSEGLHNGSAWQWSPQGGVEEQRQKAAAALRHGIEMPGRFFTLLGVRDRGTTITLEGSVAEGGRQQWQVRVVLDDGFSRDYFIDQDTSRISRQRDRRAFHPGVDPTPQTVETRFQDELWIDGVLLFRRSDNVDPDNDEWLGTSQLRSVEHNIELPERYFLPQ
jgi:hypothetical protein